MSNIEKLSSAGLIAKDAVFSEDEVAALESMSELEVSALVSAKVSVHEPADEPRVPTFHVSI
ncbi:Hypothetical protein A7982_02110 [Minicystis rosea]|nr:Hypothetical protein A7982_02110 [Minicystis rosea]